MTAQALAPSFYRQLRMHGEVDLALVEAYAGLAEHSDINVPALYSRLGARPLFSDALDRELTNSEIRFGLARLEELLPERAPELLKPFEIQAATLRGTLGAEVGALSRVIRVDRERALAEINKLCDEVLELNFNALALGQDPPPYDARCPFPGLYPFDVKNQEFFFGRDALIEKLQKRLDEYHFLAVLGPSGSGKSSLVLAGLIPKLQKKEPNLQWVSFTPGSDPLVKLEVSLNQVGDQLSIIVVDQFEEVFTLCTDKDERWKFLDRILALTEQQWVVITMRADFWGDCALHEDLKKMMLAHQELISPMNTAELREAIELQAKAMSLRLDAYLSNTILDDVRDEPGAMPLLQHALRELWKRRHGRWLPSEEYRAIAKCTENDLYKEQPPVVRAIACRADAVYKELSPTKQEQVRDIFVRMTRLDEGAVQYEERRDTRRRVEIAELVPEGGELETTKALVKHLTDKRLVVTSVNNAIDREEVEVAHEALIRYWPRLREWLNEDRANIQLREEIGEAAREWEKEKGDESYLVHRGSRLQDAEALDRQPKPGYALNKQERDYINACLALRNRTARREKRLRDLRRRAVEAIMLCLVVALVSVSIAYYLENQLRASLPAPVTTTKDDGSAGSLREVIKNAKNGDVIWFARNVKGMIKLTRELEINMDLAIIGPGS